MVIHFSSLLIKSLKHCIINKIRDNFITKPKIQTSYVHKFNDTLILFLLIKLVRCAEAFKNIFYIVTFAFSVFSGALKMSKGFCLNRCQIYLLIFQKFSSPRCFFYRCAQKSKCRESQFRPFCTDQILSEYHVDHP